MPKTFWKLFAVVILGLVLQTAGRYANQKVYAANHDSMPVWCLSEEVCFDMIGDPDHSVLTGQSKYPILADILPIWKFRDGGVEVEGMASVGDVGIIGGLLVFELGFVVLVANLIFEPIFRLWKYFLTK